MSDPSWTSRRLLNWTTKHFEHKGIDSPRRSAEMLLAHVLSVERLKLYMDPDRPAADLERAAFRDLVERAADHEPVDYLTGESLFFSMLFKVTSATLIPRPSTETLVEHVIQHARNTPGFRQPMIADVGTGSGIIAITLAKHIPDSRVLATDISSDAIDIAKENAQRHGVSDRIDFVVGDLLEPLRPYRGRIRYLCSNPPYIPDDEWPEVAANVKNFEPTTALRGGRDGLDFLRPLVEGAGELLDSPGQLVLECAAVHKKTITAMAGDAGLTAVHTLADHEGLPRVLVADQ